MAAKPIPFLTAAPVKATMEEVGVYCTMVVEGFLVEPGTTVAGTVSAGLVEAGTVVPGTTTVSWAGAEAPG